MLMDCKGMAFFSTANFMLQTPSQDQDATPPPPPPLHHDLPSTSWFPQDYLGKRSMPFMGFEPQEHVNAGDEELSSEDMDGSYSVQAGEKKKRLSIEQVRTLEKSFEMHGNKLEPERKLQLAKAVGLQPRQVAIWFQNRRARWKTKQLEKEYDVLRRQFDSVKADNDALHSENRKLHEEIMSLKGREHPIRELIINLNKESEGSGSNRSSETLNSDLKLNFSSSIPPYSITEHKHEHDHDTTHSPIPTSKQLFPVPSGLANLFPNIDASSGFWPWLDQHQHLNN